MNYIDFHCDTLLLKNFPDRPDTLDKNSWCVDFTRMKQGDCAAQFFAIFLPTINYFARNHLPRPTDWEYVVLRHHDILKELDLHRDKIAFAGSLQEHQNNRQNGRMSAFLTIEDGRVLAHDLAGVDRLHSMGIRIITLTWNNPNCLGAPQSADPAKMNMGLTAFGRQAVCYMQEKGILVDVSHLSDGGFWDVVRCSKKPFIASHSNCRALCSHPRNLSDEMITALANAGGGAGLNFSPELLSASAGGSRIEDMIAHIWHFIRVGGEDFPMIGTDFDGMHGVLEIASSAEMPKLFEALEKAGLNSCQIEKIAFKNAERVINDAIA